jgi:hypothetical protein
MCLATKTPKLKIAEQPIICYKKGKVKKFTFRPYIQTQFKYKLGKVTEKTEIEFKKNDYIVPSDWYEVEEGYHSFPTFQVYYPTNHVFIIPKGVKYTEGQYNGTDNYCSEQLIWVGHRKNPLTWLRVYLHKRKNK